MKAAGIILHRAIQGVIKKMLADPDGKKTFQEFLFRCCEKLTFGKIPDTERESVVKTALQGLTRAKEVSYDRKKREWQLLPAGMSFEVFRQFCSREAQELVGIQDLLDERDPYEIKDALQEAFNGALTPRAFILSEFDEDLARREYETEQELEAQEHQFDEEE